MLVCLPRTVAYSLLGMWAGDPLRRCFLVSEADEQLERPLDLHNAMATK